MVRTATYSRTKLGSLLDCLAVNDNSRTTLRILACFHRLADEPYDLHLYIAWTQNSNNRVLDIPPYSSASYDSYSTRREPKRRPKFCFVAGRHSRCEKDKLYSCREKRSSNRTKLLAELNRCIQNRIALIENNPVELESYGKPVKKLAEVVRYKRLGGDK